MNKFDYNKIEKTEKIFLAKKIYPSKEIWEKLGFKFYDTEDNDILCKASLPEGWYTEIKNGLDESHKYIYLLDENGRKRGTMFYIAPTTNNPASAVMFLNEKYSIHTPKTEEQTTVYFGDEEEKLYVAGTITHTTSNSNTRYYDEVILLMNEAMNWAKINYPNYKDVTAYWDLPIKKDKKTKSIYQ